MKNYLFGLLLVLLAACENKVANKDNTLSGSEVLNNIYPKLKLPLNIVDSTIDNVIKNATSIGLEKITAEIPDTIFNTPFGNERKLTIYPIGKIEQKGKESYYATYAKGNNKTAVYLSVFDSGKHMASMPVIVSDKDDIINSASLDKKLTIAINKEWTTKNILFYNRAIYAYNNVGIFTTVLTETNEEKSAGSILINPLDTFPKRNKYSGDYTSGKKSFLFIRDSNIPTEYLFFVRFQNSDEEPCSGELRGRFQMVSDKAGRFSGTGDPCVLDLTFTSNQVSIKENGSCGNYRGIKCFFNETYTKKKDPTTSTIKNKR